MIQIGSGARLALRETVVLGRYGEPPAGRIELTTRAQRSSGTPVLVDAWTAGGGDPATSTAPPDAGPELRDRRIDHVLFRPGRFAQQVTVSAATRADGPSDHRAIVCDLSWTG